MPQKAKADVSGSETKTADYVYAHLKELTQMARQENLTMLVYLLEMAQIEAMELSQQIRPAGRR
ncbi:hypothetical protein [Cohaesibacter celericrescens]|uniref:Uncharacterized protein n=1 Tax=Cohaesibacter celericrescens TaxID=2067669 RepID=A0A2N5XS20_9HYPH|nr:hypothetical protein [Cohaesibacter celericrescens]PLW77312.1 hypothetical protein C0081_08170 [Cohaesibacter celericrescens]